MGENQVHGKYLEGNFQFSKNNEGLVYANGSRHRKETKQRHFVYKIRIR